MFAKNEDIQKVDMVPGASRKVLTYSDELMMVELTFEKGVALDAHTHEHLQITYIVEGKFEFVVDGKKEVVGKGDSVYMPSNSLHSLACLEDGIIVDVFNPMRKDFL